MDIKQIENIVTIADEGNLSRASKVLYISQPALSQQLHKLEEDLGVALFTRTMHKMIPTPAGELYIAGARKIIKQKNATYSQIRGLTKKKLSEIVIGVAPGRCPAIISSIYTRFQMAYPDCTLKCITQDFAQAEESLQNETLEISFVALTDFDYSFRSSHEIVFHEFPQEEIYLAVSSNHPFAKKIEAKAGDIIDDQDLSVFYNSPLALTPSGSKFRRLVDDILKDTDFQPQSTYEVLDIRAAYSAMADGTCLTFVPANYVPRSSWEVHFRLKPRRYWNFAIAWNRNHDLSEAEQYFIRLCDEYFADGSKE